MKNGNPIDESSLGLSWTINDTAKGNYSSAINEILEIQNTNKINAVFTISIIQNESSGGLNELSEQAKNWMSVMGSYNGKSYTDSKYGYVWRVYDSFNQAVLDFANVMNQSNFFGTGKYDTDYLCEEYNIPGYGDKVNATMDYFYSKIQLDEPNSGTNSNGDQPNAITHTGIGGRTFTNYIQHVEEYQNIPLGGDEAYFSEGTNLYNCGCAVTSVAIIASGFGYNVGPKEVNQYYTDEIGEAVHGTALNHYTGMKCYETDGKKSEILEQLERGLPVIVRVNGAPRAYGNSHYFTIIDISDAKDQVYVSDPASSFPSTNASGWQSISILDDPCIYRYIKMEEY